MMIISQHSRLKAFTNIRSLSIVIIAIAISLSACSGSSDTSAPTDNMNPVAPIDAGNNTDTTASARYRLSFTATWSQQTHAQNFPGNPHFSGLVGAVHNEQVIFWEPGQMASPGVQLMAETGSKANILPEIQTAIDAGSALSSISEAGIGPSPGTIAIEFVVNKDYPQITIASMLAPSPDWFIGLHNYSLISDGDFVQNAQIDLVLYDSGSDSGVQYQSTNTATDPLSPIAPVNSEDEDSPFVDGKPFVGSITIERLLPE